MAKVQQLRSTSPAFADLLNMNIHMNIHIPYEYEYFM